MKAVEKRVIIGTAVIINKYSQSSSDYGDVSNDCEDLTEILRDFEGDTLRITIERIVE